MAVVEVLVVLVRLACYGMPMARPSRMPPRPPAHHCRLALPLVLTEFQVRAPTSAGPAAALPWIPPALRPLCGAVPALREPSLAQKADLRLGVAGLGAALSGGLVVTVVALLRPSVLGGLVRLARGRDEQASHELIWGMLTG